MKNRSEVLKSKGYWTADIQLKLFDAIREFMKTEGMNQTQLADHLKVTKGYVTQILNGDFDHKTSKLVELALAIGKIPNLCLEDMDKFIEDDAMGISDISQRERPQINLVGLSFNYTPKNKEMATFTESIEMETR